MPLPDQLRTLLTSFGPSGVETDAAATWREAARAFTDDVAGDVLGSSFYANEASRTLSGTP